MEAISQAKIQESAYRESSSRRSDTASESSPANQQPSPSSRQQQQPHNPRQTQGISGSAAVARRAATPQGSRVPRPSSPSIARIKQAQQQIMSQMTVGNQSNQQPEQSSKQQR